MSANAATPVSLGALESSIYGVAAIVCIVLTKHFADHRSHKHGTHTPYTHALTAALAFAGVLTSVLAVQSSARTALLAADARGQQHSAGWPTGPSNSLRLSARDLATVRALQGQVATSPPLPESTARAAMY